MRRRFLVALVGVLALAAASASVVSASVAGASAPAANKKEPFLILFPTSVGAPGAIGQQAQAGVQGVKAAVQVLNDKGGILGRKVQLEVLDDAGKTDTGVGQLQQRLQQSPKPDLVIPGSISTQGVAYVPIASNAGVVSIGTPSALELNDPQKYPLNFQEPPSQVNYAAEMLGAAKAQGAKKLAALSSTSAFGQTWQTAIKEANNKAKFPISYENYADTDLDMTAQLQRLRDTGADTLLLQGFGAPVGRVLDGRTKLGWNAPVLCDSTCGVTPLMVTDLVGTPQLQGVTMQVPHINVYTPPDKRTPAQKTYLKALQSTGPTTGIQTQYSFQYDGVMAIAAAAEQAKSADSTKIAKTLEKLKTPDPTPFVTLAEYKYSKADHAATGSGHDFVMVTPTHLVDGQVGAPGA